LKIGELASLTGWFAFVDVTMNACAQIEADLINANGGITVNGQKYNIQLIAEDCKSGMDGVTSAAVKLITSDGVKFIIGPSAFFSSAAAPPCEQNKVLHVSIMNTGTPGEMSKDTPYAFLGANGGASHILCQIQAMKKAYSNVKKVAIITPDDGSVPYLIPFAKGALASAGYQQAGSLVTFPNNTQDYSSIAIKLNAISDADAIFQVNAAPPDLANIVKQLRQLGNMKPYVCNVGSTDILPIINSNDLATEVICKDIVPNGLDNPPEMDTLLNKMIEKYGSGQSVTFPDHASALYTLCYIIEQAQSLDPDVVKAKWESLTSVPTLFGEAPLGGLQTYGLKNHAVNTALPFSVLRNGKAEPLGWITPSTLP
jgi:ABC-type branched-subunit amino acid transport system substrate-binding protein